MQPDVKKETAADDRICQKSDRLLLDSHVPIHDKRPNDQQNIEYGNAYFPLSDLPVFAECQIQEISQQSNADVKAEITKCSALIVIVLTDIKADAGKQGCQVNCRIHTDQYPYKTIFTVWTDDMQEKDENYRAYDIT